MIARRYIPWIFGPVLLFLQCWFVPLFAQPLRISVPKDTISFNETVTVTLSGEVSDINSFAELPTSSGFIVVGRSSQYSFNSTNRKIRLNQHFTLQPLKTGSFSVGPAWVQAGSRRVFSNQLTIVVKAEPAATAASNLVFLRCEPSRRKAFLGEQIILTLRLYSRVDGVSSADRPLAKTFDGFLYQPGPYPVDENYKDTIVTVNGLKYAGTVVYREFVYPNRTGKLTIPSYQFSCVLRVNPYPVDDDLINSLMAIPQSVELNSDPIPIEVIPTPGEEKPADFAGDVGNFSLSASIDKAGVKATDAVKFSVTVSGEGNLGFVQLHAPDFPDGIESYPPVASDSIRAGSDGVSGDKTFTFTLIPKKEGHYTIPGVSFSYFDPAKKKYVTLNTEAFELNVAPAPPQETKIENNLPGSFLDEQHSYRLALNILLIALAPLALVAFLLWRKKKNGKAEEAVQPAVSAEAAPAEAPVITHGQLVRNQVRFLLGNAAQQNTAAALPALYEALLLACCERCELSREEASLTQIRYRLGIKGFSAADTASITSLVDQLAGLRFMPGSVSPQEASALFEKTRALLAVMGY